MMAKKVPEPTHPPVERAFLVGLDIKGEFSLLSLEDSLSELELLSNTAGLEIVGETSQKLERPNPETLVGTGKVEEIKALVEETLADIVIFDHELSPRHQRELENKFGLNVRVLDRTALILDIFAQHAHTHDGKLQVQLAQYEYRLPRLTRAWTHLARQAGGGGGRAGSVGGVGLRGPGETQLEVDRREIRRKVKILKNELEKIRSHRSRYRAKRKQSMIPMIALVGYTNAGKSTLLNRLSKSNLYVADKLFATLDPTTRRVIFPAGRVGLLTDTVGFIQKLPTQLVAAFRATLEEIAEADLLIHVLDITHINALAQWKAVQNTLEEIGAGHIPVITVLNKIDQLPDNYLDVQLLKDQTGAIPISAKTGQGVANLLQQVEKQLFETFKPIRVRLPYAQGQLISLFHELGQVESSNEERGAVIISGTIPGRLVALFQPYIDQGKDQEDPI